MLPFLHHSYITWINKYVCIHSVFGIALLICIGCRILWFISTFGISSVEKNCHFCCYFSYSMSWNIFQTQVWFLDTILFSCKNWRGNIIGSWNGFGYRWDCCCRKLGFSNAGKYTSFSSCISHIDGCIDSNHFAVSASDAPIVIYVLFIISCGSNSRGT